MWVGARRVLFLTVFIDLMGFGIVVPILAFVAEEYGASGMTLGLILASFSLMQFLFSPVWGRLSDRIGRRPVLMISIFGNILGFGTFALASNVAMLFATRMFSGIASASIAAAQAYVADTTDEEHRAKGMTIISLAFGLGLILGPPFGGLLSTVGTQRALPPNFFPGMAAAALSTVALLMAIFLLPESLKNPRASERRSFFDGESWSLFARERRLRLSGSALAVLMCSMASLSPIFVLVGKDQYGINAKQVGYLFGLMGVVVVVLQLAAVHRLSQRLGDVKTAMLGATSALIGLLVILVSTSPAMLILATCCMGGAQGLVHPTLSAYISKVAPPTHRGGILGVSGSLMALGRVLGPPLAGLAYDAMKGPGALISQMTIVALGILIASRVLTIREDS